TGRRVPAVRTQQWGDHPLINADGKDEELLEQFRHELACRSTEYNFLPARVPHESAFLSLGIDDDVRHLAVLTVHELYAHFLKVVANPVGERVIPVSARLFPQINKNSENAVEQSVVGRCLFLKPEYLLHEIYKCFREVREGFSGYGGERLVARLEIIYARGHFEEH